MPFNIDTFKTNISDFGYLQNNRFSIVLTPPPLLSGSLDNNGSSIPITDIANQMKFRIEEVKLPGINLLTINNNRYGVGPAQKQPYSAQFNQNNFTIISDGYGAIWQFWHNWARKVFDFTSTENNSSTPASYASNYKSEYSSSISLNVYDLFGSEIMKVDMLEAFPVAVYDTPLSWGNNNDLMKINISLAFKEYILSGASF